VGTSLLVALPLALIAAYAFYRFAVTETLVFGKLLAGAFDLYRLPLLLQLGFEPPALLHEERLLWQRLAAFVRRGEPFYHPGDGRLRQPPERALDEQLDREEVTP
jgi:hypothetical protein